MKRSILTLCLLGQVLFLWAQNQYYVAPNGNDNHDGSFQKPFQTIERAQLEARKAQGETTIYLRKGIYRLESSPPKTVEKRNHYPYVPSAMNK